jgi:hypothetical protein
MARIQWIFTDETQEYVQTDENFLTLRSRSGHKSTQRKNKKYNGKMRLMVKPPTEHASVAIPGGEDAYRRKFF